MFKKLAVVAAVAAAFSGSAFAVPAYITNGGAAGAEATISDAGYFQPGGIGLRYQGVEYVNIDTQSSWYWFSPVGPADSVFGTNPLGATTFGAGPAASSTNVLGGWSFAQSTIASSTDRVSVTLTITNNTGSAAKGAQWSVGFDPDQDGSGNNTTINTIVGAAGKAAVQAVGPISKYSVILENDTSALASAVTAYISGPCCSPFSAATAFAAGQAVGFTNTGDNAIGLAYNLGDIAAGASVSIGYSYHMAAIPEPETYALMLAGLGAIGFIAKRRKIA